MLLRYASVCAAGAELKTIVPPEFADSADADICYTYEINLKNGLFAADELVFLQLEDEEYYFKILPANGMASDMADDPPNTASGKMAESTSSEVAGAAVRDTVVVTVADSAENRASDDEARVERSLDAARDMNAEAADEAASGATKEIASERAGDAPCEYKVYVRDYAQSEDRLFADDFYGFLEKF
nr:hypothetical protein [uncultured Campylobacter sp.]